MVIAAMAAQSAATQGLKEARAEIERLQDANRRALAIADERSRQNVGLRADIEKLREALKTAQATLSDGAFTGPMVDAALREIALARALEQKRTTPMADMEAKAREGVEKFIAEVTAPYRKFINETPVLLSVLYDIDLLPEQIRLPVNATRMAAFCELWQKGHAAFGS